MVSLSLLQMERSGSSTRWGGGREVRFYFINNWLSLVGQRPEKQGFSWLVCAGNGGWFPTSLFTVCVDQIVCRECSRPCNDIHVLSFLVKTMQIKFLHYSESCPLCAASQSVRVVLSSSQNYTQYIPLSLYDLQAWMGSPSIYIFDCSNAGTVHALAASCVPRNNITHSGYNIICWKLWQIWHTYTKGIE